MLDRVNTLHRFRGAGCARSAVVLMWGSLGCASAGPCPRAPSAGAATSSSKSEGQLAALSLELPRASQWSPVQPVIVVELAASGERRLHGERLKGDAVLLARLRSAHAKSPSAPAVIRADVQARHERVIHVMDLLRQAGIQTLAFAVTPVGQGASAPPPVAATSAAQSSAGSTADAARPEARARPLSAWNCSFPPSQETEAISATVELVVSVDERGKARWVRVLQDPGYGYGQAATLCALRVAYEPGRDVHGRPVPSMSPSIRIRFEPVEKQGPSR